MAIRLRKRKSGSSYQAWFRSDGKVFSKYFHRKFDAERWLRDQLSEREHGTLKDSTELSFEEFQATWLESYRIKVSSRTYLNAQMFLKNWILPELGPKKFNRIVKNDVVKLTSRMLDAGLSARSANYVIAVIRKIFNDAHNDWNLNIRNAAVGIKIPGQSLKLSFWDEKEVRHFLNFIKQRHPTHHLLFRFLLNTGVRIGEAFALAWDDVDLKKGSICIRRNLNKVSGKIEARTKSNRIRYIGLNPDLVRDLSQAKTDSAELVFANESGRPMCLSNIYARCFLPAMRNASLKRIRIHDLRHTFAAHFVMNGGSIYDLKQILGHSDIKMTERYAHLAPDYIQSRCAVVQF